MNTPAGAHNGDVTDSSNAQSLRAQMANLARTMQTRTDSVDRTLELITGAAVDSVPGAEHAGITLVVGRHRVESRAPTSPVPQKLDEFQEHLQEGPCLRAIREQETVQIDDLSAEQRWPRFAHEAVALGIRSILAFQLYTGEKNLGALNLYSERPNAFDRASYDAGFTLATHAAIALVGAQREAQLQSALASRDIIGQAKGMLMERFDIDAVRAFDLLARLSQDTNCAVAELARKLVERDHPER